MSGARVLLSLLSLSASEVPAPPPPAASSVASVGPLAETRRVLEAARAIVAAEVSHDEKLESLSQLLGQFLDTETMGRSALEPHLGELSPAEQREILGLFRELFQRSYVQKLLLFERPNFGYLGERREGDGAYVDTSIITPRDEFRVTYRLRPEGRGWVATDISIEGMSLTRNLARQMERIVSASSVQALLQRMRSKYGTRGDQP